MQALLISLITWLIAGAEAWFAYPIVNTPLVLCPIVGAICGDLGVLENGNPQKRTLLKRIVMGYVGILKNFSYSKYRELEEEIEKL